MTKTVDFKNFQLEAIVDISSKIIEQLMLAYDERQELHIVAPTGSGKTVIMKGVLEELFQKEFFITNKFIPIWFSPAKANLTEQSFNSVKEQFNDNLISVKKIEELKDNQRNKHSIFFTAWETINKETNVLIKGGDTITPLLSTISSLKNQGYHFIGIIDEAHLNYGNKDSKSLKAYKMFDCELTICMTATPIDVEAIEFVNEHNFVKNTKSSDIDEVGKTDNRTKEYKKNKINKWLYLIPEFKVIEEELITKEIHYNVKVDTGKILEEKDNYTYIRLGLERLRQLQELNKLHQTGYKPLMLIQIKDNVTNKKGNEELDLKLNEIENYLKQKGIEYRIWVHNNKLSDEEKQKIKDNDSDIEVLIFKQVATAGWDCPRAKILVKERDTKSTSFNNQVLGRIRRIPYGRYNEKEPLLNDSYVYTRFEETENNLKQKKELNKTQGNKIKTQFKINKPFQIPSFLSNPKFVFYYDLALNFLEKEKTLLQLNSLNTKDYDEKIKGFSKDRRTNENISSYAGLSTTDETMTLASVKLEVQQKISKIVHPFQEGLTTNLIIQLLFDYFSIRYGIQTYEEVYFLIINNFTTIESGLKNVFKTLKKQTYNEWFEKDLIYQNDYSIPSELFYDKTDDKNYFESPTLLKSYVYEDSYVYNNFSYNERLFLNSLIMKENNIESWFKNFEGTTAFCLISNEGIKFYPDFLIKTKDGFVWIYEIKGYGDYNITQKEEMILKKETLNQYLSIAKSKGYKIKGEIISYCESKKQWYCWKNEDEKKNNSNWEEYTLFT